MELSIFVGLELLMGFVNNRIPPGYFVFFNRTLTNSPSPDGTETFISELLALMISQSNESLLRKIRQPSVLLMEIMGALPRTCLRKKKSKKMSFSHLMAASYGARRSIWNDFSCWDRRLCSLMFSSKGQFNSTSGAALEPNTDKLLQPHRCTADSSPHEQHSVLTMNISLHWSRLSKLSVWPIPKLSTSNLQWSRLSHTSEVTGGL